jgi:hypothetical protein
MKHEVPESDIRKNRNASLYENGIRIHVFQFFIRSIPLNIEDTIEEVPMISQSVKNL